MIDSSERCPTYLFVLPWSLELIGGVNQVVINLAREMALLGNNKPLVLVNDWSSVKPKCQSVLGIDVVTWRVWPFNSEKSVKETIAYFLWEKRFSRDFLNFCVERNVIAINCHYPGVYTLTLARVLRRFSVKPKLILSFHGNDIDPIIASNMSLREEWKRLIGQVDHVVTCSKQLQLAVRNVFWHLVEPIVIYSGIDLNLFNPGNSPHVDRTPRKLLSVGRFEAQKGQDRLIKAFSEIAPDYPELLLVLVGKEDNELSVLKEMCFSLGIADRVSFETDIPHKEIPAYYQDAYAFILPSRRESFGLVLLEAGAFGLPTISFNVGGVPEIIDDGETGLLVEPGDGQGLVKALRKILDDSQFASQLGMKLQQKVRITFNWRASAKNYLALIADS